MTPWLPLHINRTLDIAELGMGPNLDKLHFDHAQRPGAQFSVPDCWRVFAHM